MLNFGWTRFSRDVTAFHEGSKRREDGFVMSRRTAVLIVLAAAFLSTNTPHAQAPKRLALVGGMLVTGYDVAPIHHAAILIEGNRIVAAGPSSDVRIAADATVIDTSGRTMMPGLIETHGHLVVLGHGAYETWFPWITSHGGEQMLTRVMEISARQLLTAGITTAVDLGAPLKERSSSPTSSTPAVRSS